MREKKRFIVLAMALATTLALTPAVDAHQSPEGCLGTPPSVKFADETLNQLDSPLREGDEVTLAVDLSNQAESACDLSGIMIRVFVPDPAAPDGGEFLISNNTRLSAGDALKIIRHPGWILNLDDASFEGQLKITWQAISHNSQTDSTIEGTGPGAKVTVTRPQASLAVLPTVNSGEPPLDVKYFYALTNNSRASSAGLSAPSLVPTGDPGSRQALSDSNCESVDYLSGDSPTLIEPVIDPGETWFFTCSRSLNLPGTYMSQPSISGTSSIDNRAWPQATATGGTTVTVLGSDLVLDKSHVGDLQAGTPGSYKLKVTNTGNQATSGQVTVTDQLPAGLDPKSIHGEGWDCALGSLTCTRQDPLGSGSSFPVITLKVTPPANAPASVINTASVSGGGEAPAAASNNSDSDPTTIKIPGLPDPTPVNAFDVASIVPRDDGTAKIRLRMPGPGTVTIDDASTRINRLVKLVKPLPGRGTYKVTVKPTARFYTQMAKSKRAMPTSMRISFTPTGGLTSSRVRKVSLRVR